MVGRLGVVNKTRNRPKMELFMLCPMSPNQDLIIVLALLEETLKLVNQELPVSRR